MICRLCLKDTVCVIEIFTEVGVELETAKIIAKHFWFEPKSDDPISTSVCEACWNKVSDFHDFYENVEEAHRLLTERFSLNVTKPKLGPVAINENSVTTTATDIKNLTAEASFGKGELVPFAKNSSNWIDAHVQGNLETQCNNDESCDVEDGFAAFLDLDHSNMNDEDARIEPETSIVNTRSRRITNARYIKKTTQEIPLNVKKTIQPLKSNDTNLTPKRRGRPKRKLNSPTSTEIVDATLETPKCTKMRARLKVSTENVDKRIAEYLCLRCDVCGEEQATFAELRKHMINVHHTERPYGICCDKRFYKRALLFDHVEKHFNPESFKCNECNKNFADKQCLRNHLILKHQPEEAKTFSCEFCEKKFAKMYLLEKHREMHEERKHVCELCEKRFSTIHQLKAHIKGIHHNYGRMCDICAKVIRGRSVFERHVLEHQGIKLPKVQCPKCGSWHKDKYCLQKHIRRHNEEGTVHTCTECGKVAPNRSALLAHKRYVHKAERNYECGICKKSFKKLINLKEHMAMHTGETLYNCPHCSRTFNSKANMYSHRKKMHTKALAEERSTDTCISKDDSSLGATEEERINQKDKPITGNNDETHILVLTDNGGELVFEVA